MVRSTKSLMILFKIICLIPMHASSTSPLWGEEPAKPENRVYYREPGNELFQQALVPRSQEPDLRYLIEKFRNYDPLEAELFGPMYRLDPRNKIHLLSISYHENKLQEECLGRH